MYIYNSCILHTMYSTCTCTTDMLYNVQYKHMYSTRSRVHTHLMLYNIYIHVLRILYIYNVQTITMYDVFMKYPVHVPLRMHFYHNMPDQQNVSSAQLPSC